jgi:hypothetical protein
LLACAEAEAERIVAQHWQQIETLATELLVWRRLDAEQIKTTIESALLGPAARRRKNWEQRVVGARGVLFARG